VTIGLITIKKQANCTPASPKIALYAIY